MIREESAEVFYSDGSIRTAGPEEIDFLKERASKSPRRRARLCMHDGPEASVHEMLIVHHREAYVRPHRHRAKGESFHVVEGEATVILFDERGNVVERIRIGAAGRGYPFYYRFAGEIPHMLLIDSEWLVFAETTNGPFDRAQTELMSWSPDEADKAAVASYMRSLRA